ALTRPTVRAVCSPGKRSATRRNNRTKPTILSRFFSKNESSLAILFYSFIKLPAPEILPP
ncbi:hypothetical protein ACNQ0S_15100, partial [Enterobacter cloacae complex sp.6700816]